MDSISHIIQCLVSRPNNLLGALSIPLQIINLFPQNIGTERPKRLLDPPLRLGVFGDCPLGRRNARQEARLAAQKQPAQPEEGVGHDIAERRGFQQRRDVWDGFFAAVGEAHVRRFLGRLDGLVHGVAVGADPEGQEAA